MWECLYGPTCVTQQRKILLQSPTLNFKEMFSREMSILLVKEISISIHYVFPTSLSRNLILALMIIKIPAAAAFFPTGKYRSMSMHGMWAVLHFISSYPSKLCFVFISSSLLFWWNYKFHLYLILQYQWWRRMMAELLSLYVILVSC